MLALRIDNLAHLGPLNRIPGVVLKEIRDRLNPLPVSAISAEVLCGFLRDGQEVDFDSALYWEDHSFCFKARKLGFEVWLIPSASVGHVGENHVVEKTPWEFWLAATSKSGCEGRSPAVYDGDTKLFSEC